MPDIKIERDTSSYLSTTMNAITNPKLRLKHNLNSQDIRLAQQINTHVSQFVLSRVKYYAELAQYRRNWVVEGLYDTFNNDILLDNTRDDTIEVEVLGREDLTEELKSLFKKLNIVEILHSIMDDYLHLL